MSRVSKKYKILFIEEPDQPVDGRSENSFEIKQVSENLTVFTPFLKWNDWKAMCREYVPLLQQHVEDLEQTLFWFYSPFYVHVLQYLTPSLIVYDCMDELSAFKNASPNLPANERQLLDKTDIVFTGGKSLYEAKKHLHSNVFCFPSSVDRSHFERAALEETVIPEDLAALSKPVVGYYGVIDERIDFALLHKVSRVLPDVSFVMIGPFAKIEREDAAQGANIYYPGKRTYELLPNYLKGIEVAMMPFVISPATRYISPTKTLEYMAAGKPIVSTPIHDVVRDYQEVVGIASDADEFVRRIKHYLQETNAEKAKRTNAQRLVVEKTSWEQTVVEMDRIITERKFDRIRNDGAIKQSG
jgi:glycosyltransferase involved in cell wall biosynthesis